MANLQNPKYQCKQGGVHHCYQIAANEPINDKIDLIRQFKASYPQNLAQRLVSLTTSHPDASSSANNLTFIELNHKLVDKNGNMTRHIATLKISFVAPNNDYDRAEQEAQRP